MSLEFSLSECGQLAQMWNSASGAPQGSSSQYARRGQFSPQCKLKSGVLQRHVTNAKETRRLEVQ
jgi:hypothetical protein